MHFLLLLYDETTLAFESAGIELTFDDPVDGRYRGFMFTQAGQQFNFELKEDSE